MALQTKDRSKPGVAVPGKSKAKGKKPQSPAYSTAADGNGLSNSQAKLLTPPLAHIQHQPHQPQQGPSSAQIQQLSRPGSIVQQQQNPSSPHQSASAQHPGQYGSPHSISLQQQQQHQSPYPPPAAPPGQYSQVPQYGNYPSPYGTPQSQFSSAASVESMAAAQMHRSFQPPMYGYPPQNNAPVPVSSPQTHDAHGRPMYQPQQNMSAMYPSSYPSMGQGVGQVHQSPHGQHGPPTGQPQPQQHQGLPSHSLLMSYSQQLQHQSQQQQSPSHPGLTNSPRTKLEPAAMQRPMDQPNLQRPPSASINTNVGGPPNSANSMQQGSPASAGGVNSNAAPGPIPATTPLVVRQDNNGVQWIAFEYSRDRVKMEYTIRCDVESVNTENLTSDFKSENCVYPRACCNKESYRGNRLQYESECNTVGWALAELNPCLRGKRGLIQRAVDSWRNSNSDPKLRSRRVRRQAKMQSRNKHQIPNHIPGGGVPSSTPPGVGPSNPGMVAPLHRQPQQMNLGGSMAHHHHHQTDGPHGPDDVGVAASNMAGVRQAHVFQGGYSTYPPQSSLPSSTSSYPTSMPPPLHDPHTSYSLPQPNAGGAIATSVLGKRSYSAVADAQEIDVGDSARASDLFGGVPPDKRRKFIIVEDGQKGGRVRVRVEMDRVRMSEVPDSYMKNNSVYPRAWRPVVAPDVEWEDTESQGGAGSSAGRRKHRGRRDERFAATSTADEKEGEPDDSRPTIGRTLVRVPLLEGDSREDGGIDGEVCLAVPRLTEAKKHRESLLNEMGYRMSWAQSRVFAGRVQFLQKSLDAYRNKVRSTIIQSAAETGEPESEAPYVAPQFHTRRGKARYMERKKRNSSKGRE